MASLATKLEEVGVHLMACQTERRRFHGSLEDMAAAREATTVPMVCRDVIVDPYQIHEARCYGADAVTLQVAVLEQARLESLLDRTESLGDRKSTRLNSSHVAISYAVFCLKKKRDE